MEKTRIVFLPIPNNLREQFIIDAQNEFTINPDIPVPIEIPAGGEKIIPEYLTMKMILSAMLKVIEEGNVEQEWIDYYCRFILFLRPDIITILNEIKNTNLNDDSYKIAYNLIENGKPEEGLSYIRGFIEQHPLVWNGWFILGRALRLLGRFSDAQAALNKAIEIGGDNNEARNELTICLKENK
jgi:tetratricopeptide (TPR) repeat protein